MIRSTHSQTAHLQSPLHLCLPPSSYVLPFQEVIDWNKASLVVDERHLLQVPHLMRSVPTHQLLAMRMHTQFLWEAYFSSLEKIIFTTFEVPESATKLLCSAVYSERVDTLFILAATYTSHLGASIFWLL